MFERFTDRSRRVLVLAQEEALQLGHNYIGDEHILLGLIQEGDGVAARALERLGVTPEVARAAVSRAIAPSPTGKAQRGNPPFTSRAKKVLELSLREALQLGHNYIGTEHILLGIVRGRDGVAAKVLEDLTGDLDRVRTQVIALLAGGGHVTKDVPRTVLVRNPSPALGLVVENASRLAAGMRVTTWHVLRAMLGAKGSLAARALGALGVTCEALEEKVRHIPLAETTDAAPPPESVEIRLGEQRIVLDDPGTAARLANLTPQQVQELLREVLGRDQEGQPPPPEEPPPAS